MVLTSWRSVWCGRFSLAGKHLGFLDLFGDTCASRTHCHCASRFVEKVRYLFDAHVEESPIVSLLFYSGSTCSIMVLPSVLSCDFTSLFMAV